MAAKIDLYLAPHAKVEKIFEVIKKIVGHEFEYDFFGSQPDFNLPTGDNNSWFLTFKENPDNKVHLEEPSWFVLYFKDISGSRLDLSIHTDNEDGHLPICKLLNSQSSATWCAIGKRLVDFFGGKIIYNDYKDLEDPNNCYLVENPKYPAKISGESSDDRWHIYYNLLKDEGTLTSKEIKDMEKYSSMLTEKDKQLISYLEKFEQMIELKDELNNQPLATTKKITIKV